MAECETRPDCHAALLHFALPEPGGEDSGACFLHGDPWQPRPLIDRQRLASPNAAEADVVCCCISGLFTGNNTGNGVADRFCFSKDVTREPQAGDLIDTTHGWIDMEGKQTVTVLPVPFLGYLTLSSQTVGVVATAEMGLCFPWTWCGFVVKDCSGAILYKMEVDTLPDVDADGTELPGTAGLSYVIKDAVGSYLGRSSHLTDGAEPIRLLDAENTQVSMLITAAGFWRRTFFPLQWYVNTAVTREPATAVPLADPRLLTLMVTFQFRNLGYFGIFWILLLVIVVVAVYLYLRRSRGLTYDGGFSIRGACFKGLPYYSYADEEQEFLAGGDGGGCCTGRQKKTPQATAASFVKPATARHAGN
ncbi:unnamed protein product [Symbiodinium sp. CCMP2592]|nr:unnamed protein product [Symbiodinium sp. CCMP2592]